jgi:predicted metal-binding protein
MVMRKKVLDKMFDNPPPKRGIPAPKDLPRMPPARIPCSHEELEQHLQKYLKLIKDQGADDARIISARDIPQDPRVLLKCSHPKCPGYGMSGCCPPHCTGDFPKAKEYMNAYNWAIVYRVNIPPEGRKYVSGPESLASYTTKEGRHHLGSFQRYCYGMGDEVESAAFYDGHYFAINCHFGPCLTSLCEEFDHCQEIKAGVCRFPTIAKPSVEQTFCVDFIRLAAKVGWEHYMLGFCPQPQDYPQGFVSYATGLILID